MQLFKLSLHERKVIFLASLGGALEFYDFIIYVIFAPIISEVFFPKEDKLASLMSVYAIFAIGYLVRPLGGIALGHFGDKYGRKKTFVFSVMLMAFPTILIAFLPTYSEVGILASILLILLRVLQGLSIGGEIPGAITYACEHVNSHSRSLACGIIFACLNLGILSGESISMLLNRFLDNSQLLAFGWRIPFVFGGLLGIVSFYIRKHMTESPLFIAIKNNNTNRRIPIVEAINLHWRKVLQGIALTSLGAVVIHLLFLFLPTYLSTILAYPKQQAMLFCTVNLFFYSCLMVSVCALADKYGRKPIFLMGASGFVLFSIILFKCLSIQTTFALIGSLFFIAILSSTIMVYPGILVDLFPTSIRYTGIAISYNIALGFFGGLTPFIATWLLKTTSNNLSPSFYLTFVALLCFMGAIRIGSD